MGDEIQLISDGQGLAVIGDPTAVDRFLASEGLPSKDLGLPRLRSVLGNGAAAAQAGSEIAANSGRWVKLTEESAKLVKKFGLMESKTPGVSHAMVGQRGDIKAWLQIAKGPGSFLANPANLAGAAGIMAQLAMQQAMDEITDYLAAIDEKVDDVLRAQKDTALSRMIGVGLVIDEAMTVRESRGRVDEITWSKVQHAPSTIAETQAYALRQLDALAAKIEGRAKIGDLAESTQEAQAQVQDWLAVLARCFQLKDAVDVLELDRVLDSSPAELDGHRIGLVRARQDRLALISRCTEQLMVRMDTAAETANPKVLLHPTTSPVVVRSRNHVQGAITDFHGRLGIEQGPQPLGARLWSTAAADARNKALTTGAEGIGTARRVGGVTFDRARAGTGKLSSVIAERVRRGRDEKDLPADDGSTS